MVGENVFHAEIEAGGGAGNGDEGPVIQGEVGGGVTLVKQEGPGHLKDNREEEAAKTEPKAFGFMVPCRSIYNCPTELVQYRRR